MKKLMGLTMLAVFSLPVGCNTSEGVGKDIAKAGETIENASKKK